MRSILLSTGVILALGLSGAAYAGTAATTATTTQATTTAPKAAVKKASVKTSSTTGVVKAYSHKHRTLTLEDGTVFHLRHHYGTHTFKAGQNVVVTWEMKGKTHEALKVEIEKKKS